MPWFIDVVITVLALCLLLSPFLLLAAVAFQGLFTSRRDRDNEPANTMPSTRPPYLD